LEVVLTLGRRYWTMWMASTVSNLGDGVVVAALPLLAARLTRDPLGVAATTIAVRLPWLLFALLAGVIVDRRDRLRTMQGADVGRAALFGVVAALVAADAMTLPLLYVCMFAAGVLETLFDTAAMSILPAMVSPDRLDHANSRLDGAQVASNELLGPAIGGALFAAGAALPFGVNAITFAAGVALLATVAGSYRPAPTGRSMLADMRDGFAFVWRQPGIRAFAVGAGMINLGFTAAVSLLVLHAEDNLGLDALGFGLLLPAAATGGIAGSLSAPAVIRWLGRRRCVFAAVAAMALGLGGTGAAGTAWLAGAGLALFGLAGAVWNVVSVTHRQSITPDALLGRVMSGFRVIAYGAFPVGALAGGAIAAFAGIRATFYFGAATIAVLLPLLLVLLPASALEDEGRAPER
jgi:MFS family permease